MGSCGSDMEFDSEVLTESTCTDVTDDSAGEGVISSIVPAELVTKRIGTVEGRICDDVGSCKIKLFDGPSSTGVVNNENSDGVSSTVDVDMPIDSKSSGVLEEGFCDGVVSCDSERSPANKLLERSCCTDAADDGLRLGVVSLSTVEVDVKSTSTLDNRV